MTHEKKITYMRISSSICNFGFTEQQLDLLISLYELVLEKKGDAAIDDIVKVEMAVEYRAKEARRATAIREEQEKRKAKKQGKK
jgi:hypothetical protein